MGGGGLFAQKLVATMHYDLPHAKALAQEAIGCSPTAIDR
jgi:hypothetical protein